MSAAPPPTGPPKSRIALYLGIAAASAAGYYFYTAGGDPTAARKQAQHDAYKLTGQNAEAHQKSAEAGFARAGSSIDRSVADGKDRISVGVHKLDEQGGRVKQDVLGKIDQADRKIEQEAAKAKGGIMSWFGK